MLYSFLFTRIVYWIEGLIIGFSVLIFILTLTDRIKDFTHAHTQLHTHIHIYIYIYIHRERYIKKERDQRKSTERD